MRGLMMAQGQEQEKTIQDMQKIMRVFTHDLRNPLLNIQALIQEIELAVCDAKGVAEDLPESLSMLKETAHHMDELIVGSNEIYHCMFDELEHEQVDMHEMFLRCFEKLKLNEAGIELLSSGMPHVFADPWVAQRIVSELLSNAKKAIISNPKACSHLIKISSSEDDDWVYFYIEDGGCGFEELEVERVFEPFFSGKRFSYGAGMGLTRVKVWVEKHGGSINVETISPCSVVSFSLPKNKKPVQ